jgi:hypothetical protein
MSSFGAMKMKKNHTSPFVIAAVLIGFYTLITIFVVQHNETEVARYKEFVHLKEVEDSEYAANPEEATRRREVADSEAYFKESGYSPESIQGVAHRKAFAARDTYFIESGYNPQTIRKEISQPKSLEMIILWLNVLFGLIPAVIAKNKGRSFGLWWFFGATLFIGKRSRNPIFQ